MAKTFIFDFNADPANLLAKARQSAKDKDILFKGDETQGDFSGQGILGHYKIIERQIQITIHEKPFFISWKMVEEAMRKFFEK